MLQGPFLHRTPVGASPRDVEVGRGAALAPDPVVSDERGISVAASIGIVRLTHPGRIIPRKV